MKFDQPVFTAEQRALLHGKAFSLRPLSSSGMLTACSSLQVFILPTAIFLFALLTLTLSMRSQNETLVITVYYAGMFLLLVYPVVAFCIIAAGIFSRKLNSHVRWSSAIFWAWWPFWKLVLCIFACYAGTQLGNWLWYECFLPYSATADMQAYNNIDPSTSGSRLQDAGLATFNSTVSVDRSRTGCLKNGATYCVAPIITGNELSTASDGGKHDLFMAGIDCCTCPGEFRCGAWDTPARELGGVRVLQKSHNDFFKLASENWAVSYGKTVGYPVFFTWSADPVGTWQEKKVTGNRAFLISLTVSPVAFLSATFILNFLLGLFMTWGWAAAQEAPMLQGQLGRNMARRLLPNMAKYDEDQRAQLGSGL